MSKDKTYKRINIVNKKASFEFSILTKYTAGMVLGGTEVKSVKAGNASITEAYCVYDKNELYVKNMTIGTFKQASFASHEPLAVRKLLLKKAELKKLQKRGEEKGFAIVPLKLFEAENGFIKMEIALAQGKKAFDKRETIKERDVDRNMRRKED
jgi:SsrA-binding protein